MLIISKKTNIKKPDWLKTPLEQGSNLFKLNNDFKKNNINTVCKEAKCPNLNKCWNDHTATFMLLGDICTRACKFCNVKSGDPKKKIDIKEPQNIAMSIKKMKLSYAVLTMVDRDDLIDGGTSQIIKIINKIIDLQKNIKLELLAGDFGLDFSNISELINSKIVVFGHNIETVERLTKRVRDQRAGYQKSLEVLDYVNSHRKDKMFLKSSIMLGLGENLSEIEKTMNDLISVGVDILTIGQYLQPSKKHLSVKKYITPQEFKDLKNIAISKGFLSVESGPFVRSSYNAKHLYENSLKNFIKSNF